MESLYVSYARRDEEAVNALTRGLEAAELNVWRDHELRDGDSWWSVSLAQIRSCSVFLFALSDHSLHSKLCVAELEYAQALHRSIVPVQVGQMSSVRAIPLADLQIVEYWPDDVTSGFHVLEAVQMAACNAGLLPEPLPPAPPIPDDYASDRPSPAHRKNRFFSAVREWLTSGPARQTTADVQERATVDGCVFISYRRSDEPAVAGRLYDKLSHQFGENTVFMDVDSIDLGLDFMQVLEQRLMYCKVLIAVIGRDWLLARDEGGRRRLDSTDDFVRAEIEIALKRNVRVIPVFVEGAPIPEPGELPPSLQSLARRQGLRISNARFNSDCLELISTLDQILRQQQ